MRSVFPGLVVSLALVGGCTAPSTASLPLISRGPGYAPVEGLETPAIGARAQGAVLSASGEGPIGITFLPRGDRLDHAIRGTIVALAGPAPDGRFVYAVHDDRAGLAVRRAEVRGDDLPVGRFPRRIAALAISADGEQAAILAPFADDDPRSRGGVLRELVVMSLATAEVRATGFACWNSTPAWIDAQRVACVVAREDGARSIALVDLRDPGPARDLGPGEFVLAETAPGDAPGDAPASVLVSVLVFRRVDDVLTAVRVALADGAATPLALRGSLQPMACVGDGLLVSFSAPTLGQEAQWEFDLFGPQFALATIKLHDLATGSFHTVEKRASPRRIWSAGRLRTP